MIARTWWSAKLGAKSAEKPETDAGDKGSALPVHDLLDARFDDEGRLSQLGRGSRQRIAETLDPRPADSSIDELDLAVQKLSEGLEAIERQSRAPRPEPSPSRPEVSAPDRAAEDADAASGRDFVTYSLDRLEARLEALSKRLQQRTGGASSESAPAQGARRSGSHLAVAQEELAAQLAESRRLAEAEEARRLAREAERAREKESGVHALLEAEQARIEAEQARLQAEAARREAERARRDADAAAEEEERRRTEATARIAEAKREAEAAEARRRTDVAEARRQAEIAEARRQAEVTEARRQVEMAEARRRADAEAAVEERRREAEEAAAREEERQAEAAAILAEAKREAEAAEARRRNEVAEARRQAEMAEARRQTELADARLQAEMAEERRQAEAAAAAEQRRREAEMAAEERRREAQQAEAIRLADLAEARRSAEAAEAQHRAELEEARRQAEITAARREAELAAMLERQFAGIEERIESLQRGLDDNQIEPVRGELLELVEQITGLSRGGRATSGALDEIGIRLDQMEVKLNAARNMAGNRLGDIQDRLVGLVERLDEIEVEIPGFDAIRVNQSAILERFDRMEGLVHRLASPEELFERVDGLKRQMQTIASQREVARIEAQILSLAERLDALPDELSDKVVLGRIEDQLGGLAAELTDARRQRKSVATELEDHLSELSSQLREVAETGRTPDLSGLEDRISSLGSQFADDRQTSVDTLARLERRIAALTDAIESQESDTEQKLLESLTAKVDSLADAIEAQDSSGARRDIEGLGERLDRIGENFVEQTDRLSRQQLEPLAQRLGAIEERLSVLSTRTADPRGVQTQLDAMVSRLELLKGRSIDPARLNELFDRVDAAVRALPEERFARLEQTLASAIAPADRFDRLEKKIAESAGGAGADRFAALERKLDEIGRGFKAGGAPMAQDDLTDLRADIVALRRELRSMPGQSEAGLGELMRTLVKRLERQPQDTPAAVANLEVQLQRIAGILEDPTQGRMALAPIEASLKMIEMRLDEARQAVGGERPAGSDDVVALKSSTEASERKTRDAIEAVQDTLEAVVKRMAFLERDADAGAAAVERRPAEAFSPRPLPVAPDLVAPTTVSPEREAPEQQPSGLLSRLTSRQLLKRATGGRAESFSPGNEEADDSSDFPLEPGTDSPLASSLTGAPSSNTEFMSGARKGRLTQPFTGDIERQGSTGRGDARPTVDDDFLAAARRAARAASQEVAEAEGDSPVERTARGFTGAIKAHRRSLVALAIAAALIIAAFPFVRPQLWPADTDVALTPEISAPVAEPETPTPTETSPAMATAPESQSPVSPEATPSQMSSATETPAASTPATSESGPASSVGETQSAAASPEPAAAAPDATAPAVAPEQPTTPEPTVAAAEPTAPEASTPAGEPVAAPDAEAASTTPANETPTAESAAVTPPPAAETPAATPPATPGSEVASVAPATAPETGAPAAAATTPPPELPVEIGPAKLRDAAMAGNTGAQFEIAARYAEGRGVLPDMTTAVSWYERAAQAGLAPAQYRLGSIYEKGLGVRKDLAAAQMWYGRAADAGNVKAMHNLAVLYAEGAGGTPDLEKASVLFRKAAERGVRDSQFNLAILHARGIGVPQDLVEAYKWFGIAASSGDEESAKRRDIIGEALSDSDKAKAEQAVATFQLVPLVPEANEVLLPEGGWTDNESSSSINVSDQNALVALVQKLLAQNGYDPGPPDGLLGRQTIDAIAEFQGKAGLPKTGQIDTGLVAALQSHST